MQAAFRAGSYDWLAIWSAMYDAEREQAERALPSDSLIQAPGCTQPASPYSRHMVDTRGIMEV